MLFFEWGATRALFILWKSRQGAAPIWNCLGETLKTINEYLLDYFLFKFEKIKWLHQAWNQLRNQKLKNDYKNSSNLISLDKLIVIICCLLIISINSFEKSRHISNGGHFNDVLCLIDNTRLVQDETTLSIKLQSILF